MANKNDLTDSGYPNLGDSASGAERLYIYNPDLPNPDRRALIDDILKGITDTDRLDALAVALLTGRIDKALLSTLDADRLDMLHHLTRNTAGVGQATADDLTADVANLRDILAKLNGYKATDRVYIPENYMEDRTDPYTYNVLKDDAAAIQDACDAAAAFYATYGHTATVRCSRKYNLLTPVSYGITDVTSRKTFIHTWPGVNFMMDEGALLRVADDLDMGYDFVLLYQEDDDHPNNGHHTLKYRTYIDYNADNNDRPAKRASTPYGGVGCYMISKSPTSIEWEAHHTGCQLIADIVLGNDFFSASNKTGWRNITLTGKIKEFQRNTGTGHRDNSAIFAYCSNDGLIYTHDLEASSALTNGKRAFTAFEFHGPHTLGPGTVSRGFFCGINSCPGVMGNATADLSGLEVYDAGRGIYLWSFKDNLAPATPDWGFTRWVSGPAKIELRPFLHARSFPFQARPSGSFSFSGGAITGWSATSAYTGGTDFDPGNPPTVSASGTGSGDTPGEITFTSGEVEGAVVTNPGSGYTTATATHSGCGVGSTPTTFNCIIENGRIVRIDLDTLGSDQTEKGIITITGDGAGATAVPVGTWGISSIAWSGGTGWSSATLVIDDSANLPGEEGSDIRVNGSMTPRGFGMVPTTGLIGLPIDLLDVSDIKAVCLDDMSRHPSENLSGIDATDTTAECWINTFIARRVFARGHAGPGIHINKTGGKNIVNLIIEDNDVSGNGRAAQTGATTGSGIHVVLGGTTAGQRVSIRRNRGVDDDPQLGQLLRCVILSNDDHVETVIEGNYLPVIEGDVTPKPFSVSLPDFTKLKITHECAAADFGSAPAIDCAVGSEIRFNDEATVYRKLATGTTGWTKQDISAASIDTLAFVSGTAKQNPEDRAIQVFLDVTYSAAGTVKLEIGPASDSLTTVGTFADADAEHGLIPFILPNGWYAKLTLTNATVSAHYLTF